MAHFSPVVHMTSGTFVSSGVQQKCDDTDTIPSKQRRLSRPNNIEEIGLKRKKRRRKKRQQERKMSKRAISEKMKEKYKKKDENRAEAMVKELSDERDRYKESRKQALYFWRKWHSERSSKQDGCVQVREIQRKKLSALPQEAIFGEGRFGCCKKMEYRGKAVAVKFYNKNSTLREVQKEAAMINGFDHPGLPYVFGICTKEKPYLLVMEFYGIDGICVTLSHAAKTNLLENLNKWVSALHSCSEAISHLHKNNFIHCDLKADNIVFNSANGNYFPIIIDFGKMKKVSDAKKKKLSEKEKAFYYKYHKQIAPEVVEGKQPASKAGDIYAFGQLISLVCFYQRHKEISVIAKSCIHGTPAKRPTIEDLVSKFSSI